MINIIKDSHLKHHTHFKIQFFFEKKMYLIYEKLIEF